MECNTSLGGISIVLDVEKIFEPTFVVHYVIPDFVVYR